VLYEAFPVLFREGVLWQYYSQLYNFYREEETGRRLLLFGFERLELILNGRELSNDEHNTINQLHDLLVEISYTTIPDDDVHIGLTIILLDDNIVLIHQ
jgi:hypothetical protein